MSFFSWPAQTRGKHAKVSNPACSFCDTLLHHAAVSTLINELTSFLHTSQKSHCQNDSCASVTCVHRSVATSQQVGEFLAAFTLAVTSRRVEAELLHQHQRLLTQVFIPVPRHPPIRIALSPAVSQWQRSPRRPHLSDGARGSRVVLTRPPFTRCELGERGGGGGGGGGNKGGTRGVLQGVLVWITETRLTCPCMTERHPPLSLYLEEIKGEKTGNVSVRT